MVFNTKFKNGITDFPQFVVNGININEALFEDNDSGVANEVITDYAGFTTPDDEPKAIHRGIDFAAQGGNKVAPIVGGVVSEVGNNFVTIEDSTGTNWVYGNIENTLELERGDVVTPIDSGDILNNTGDILNNTETGNLPIPRSPEFPEVKGSVGPITTPSITTPEVPRIEDRIGEIQKPKDESALDKEDEKAENLLHLEVLPEPTGVSSIKLDKDEGEEDVIKRDTFNPVAEFEKTIGYAVNNESSGIVEGEVYDDREFPKLTTESRDVGIEKYSEGDINPNAETWVISHGLNSNPDNFQNLAQTISDQGKQVVLVDWSNAADDDPDDDDRDDNIPDFPQPRKSASWITDVAGFASDALTDIWVYLLIVLIWLGIA